MVKVHFLPIDKAIEVPIGSSILDAAIIAGIKIESTCGGRGTCGKCKVEKRPFHAQNSLMESVLACHSILKEDTIININIQEEVLDRKTGFDQKKEVNLDSSIKKYAIHVSEPSLENHLPDWERLISNLPRQVSFNRSVIASLPRLLRNNNHEVTVVLESNTILAVEPGDTVNRSFGLAIDLGTTTLVAHLVDLTTGHIIGSRATINPQNIFGADVISRITYASQGEKELEKLHKVVIDALNSIITELAAEYGVKVEEIYQAAVVGNTTMAHLFLGIDPTYMAPAPFTPAFQQEIDIEAQELQLAMLKTGRVIVLPNVAGYVGSDTVGVMLAAEVEKLEGINLIIDIGTNGELILAGKGRILTCSTAAGPAFEGAEIKCGMRAAQGAIEGVKITDDVELSIIGDNKARGICGSGLIDAVAEMAKAGIIDTAGRFQIKSSHLENLPPQVAGRVRNTNQGAEFVLVWAQDSVEEDIVITQKDIRELQLAKGAIVAGTKILLQKLGLDYKQLDQVLLAGAFGNYIKKESAQAIGLLPPITLERITTIGNAAGEGAKKVLLSTQERGRAISLAKRAEHVELSTQKEFQDEFINSLSIGGHY